MTGLLTPTDLHDGDRVEVWLPLDEEWAAATVRILAEGTRQVLYLDETEWISGPRIKVRRAEEQKV
jgi:hypothetical protein